MKGRSGGVKMGDHERLKFMGFENRLRVLTLQEVNKQ
jgi:hypothetical protein